MGSQQPNAPLRTGDGIGIGLRETGVAVRDMYVNNHRVTAADLGSTVKIHLAMMLIYRNPIVLTVITYS
ncbi:hypothetical protein [Candidatus Methanoperedens nitratireducens]|nr:hypothetical protein [Candidatus Methanoperedens nitroreducens]